ncbi:MAG: LEPR-XLL domain-containing protein, partial [Gammaproteobacteria bacterium]|nr:LEPR-XLL domain-containing protein [Gammaproteobacteria bacterium]
MDKAVPSRFNLEALEPRILLSGDFVLSELTRQAADQTDHQNDEPPVIVEQFDASEIDSLEGSNEPVTIWPEGWVADEAIESQLEVGDVEQLEGVLETSLTEDSTEGISESREATPSTNSSTTGANDVTWATVSQIPRSAYINTISLPRAPPDQQQVQSVQTLIDNNDSNTVLERGTVVLVSTQDPVELAPVTSTEINSRPGSDAQPRAPPRDTHRSSHNGDYLFALGVASDDGDISPLTTAQLDVVLDQAIKLWSGYLQETDLGDIDVEITDL